MFFALTLTHSSLQGERQGEISETQRGKDVSQDRPSLSWIETRDKCYYNVHNFVFTTFYRIPWYLWCFPRSSCPCFPWDQSIHRGIPFYQEPDCNVGLLFLFCLFLPACVVYSCLQEIKLEILALLEMASCQILLPRSRFSGDGLHRGVVGMGCNTVLNYTFNISPIKYYFSHILILQNIIVILSQLKIKMVKIILKKCLCICLVSCRNIWKQSWIIESMPFRRAQKK